MQYSLLHSLSVSGYAFMLVCNIFNSCAYPKNIFIIVNLVLFSGMVYYGKGKSPDGDKKEQ